jgi:hypothetical protein
MLDLSDSTDDDENDNASDDYDPTLTVPYEESSEDDDSEISFPDDPNFVDSGWAVECLQDTEDIDFEFVYALHTFVATVEGQANATKGDTMVLLDDSNSYWWLVRVVKDSSIGKLDPAMFFCMNLHHARILTRRAHRDPNRTTCSFEQAQKRGRMLIGPPNTQA